jgi:integrase
LKRSGRSDRRASISSGTETSAFKTALGLARRTIARLFTRAGITGGHPHRFRDTFSVRLLEKGEQLRTVQLLLGHSSIKTTEKHFAPWVDSFQVTLDAATAKLDFGQEKPKDSGTKSGTVRGRVPK